MSSFGTAGHNLTNGGNGAWSGAGHYWTYDRTVNNDVFYKLYNNNSDYDIKFDGSNWVDVGTETPHWFGTSATDNSEIVPPGTATTLYFWNYQNATKQAANDKSGAVFLADIINNDPQSGGGTSTEGVSVNEIFLESTGALVSGTIAASEPTGSYPVTAGGVLVTGTLATNPISHTNGTSTQFSIHFAYGGYGIWHLHQNYVTSALNTPIATVTINEPSNTKKVFCNFW